MSYLPGKGAVYTWQVYVTLDLARREEATTPMSLPARRPEANGGSVAEMREYLQRALETFDDLALRVEQLRADTRLRLYALGVAEDSEVAARINAVVGRAEAGLPIEGASPADEFVDHLREKAGFSRG